MYMYQVVAFKTFLLSVGDLIVAAVVMVVVTEVMEVVVVVVAAFVFVKNVWVLGFVNR